MLAEPVSGACLSSNCCNVWACACPPSIRVVVRQILHTLKLPACQTVTEKQASLLTSSSAKRPLIWVASCIFRGPAEGAKASVSS